MGSKYRSSFFDTKREWSKYKDSILNYYLKPYLPKVAKLGKPICVVDMFAGRGEFKSGEAGSPLIIAKHLAEIANQGVSVKLLCYENFPEYYNNLTAVLKPFPFAQAIAKDCFSDIESIAKIASTHTVLLYVDPCDVGQLALPKLKMVFDLVRRNQSIEAIIVFMARGFMRHAALLRSVEIRLEESGVLGDPLERDADEDDAAMWEDYSESKEVVAKLSQLTAGNQLLSDVAGGDYWIRIVGDQTSTWEERVWRLVEGYRSKLEEWFNVVEAVPVCPDSSYVPKYWIIFASRFEPAFDLFNRAACNMMREQAANVQRGTLFANVPDVAVGAAPQAVDRAVKRAAQSIESIRWDELRWRVCGGRNVGKFTDSEVNQSIKRLLQSGWMQGASGHKVEENAKLQTTEQLRSWRER